LNPAEQVGLAPPVAIVTSAAHAAEVAQQLNALRCLVECMAVQVAQQLNILQSK
jgi:hypothetical protein